MVIPSTLSGKFFKAKEADIIICLRERLPLLFAYSFNVTPIKLIIASLSEHLFALQPFLKSLKGMS